MVLSLWVTTLLGEPLQRKELSERVAALGTGRTIAVRELWSTGTLRVLHSEVFIT